MKKPVKNLRNPSVSIAILTTLISAHLLLAGVEAKAQCPVTDLTTGLLRPIGITLSQKDNLLVSESGTSNPNTGRISIVDLKGVRRTLISGLPSGISFEANAPSGPDGLFLRGRTLYVAIGVGDAVIAGPTQGTTAPNPNPSSALFSSILAIHFSAKVEKTTTGFTLTLADQQTLANRTPVTLSNGSGDTITIELIANFPDYAPEPLPSFAGNVRNTNPFDLVAVGNQLFVTDGGRNHVWRVNLATGDYSILTAFPPIPNPLFNPTPPPPSVGGPTSEAVPTGIAYVDGKLLVTLFRGFPFAQGTSVVEQIDPQTGRHGPLITGLKTAIDVLPIKADADDGSATRYLVLQHASGAFLSPPGLLLRFETPSGPRTTLADCLTNPTAMTLDDKTGTLYVTELGGRIAAIPVAAEAYHSDASIAPTVLNISARSRVDIGDNVMIAGFIVGAGVGGGDARFIVRAVGPSLSSSGIANPLPDPLLELHDGNGAEVARNNNWKDTQQAEIEATGIPPKNDLESAIVATLAPGTYTAIVRGVGGTTGIAVVEIYALN